MLNKVARYLQEHNMLSGYNFIIAGVSGGPDSMAMLHILSKLQEEFGFQLAVAHLNHGLRPEADDEQEMVALTCAGWGIPFYSQSIDIREQAARQKKTLEEAGRDCRYQYFNQLAHQLGADRIATAHHQDDQAESVLLHLLRGSGIRGLRGIMPVNGKLIRPLLGISRQEIEQYIIEQNIPSCLDLSNQDTEFLRNRIRWQLIPILEEYNPRIKETLAGLADTAREENDVMEKAVAACWPEASREQDDGLYLDCAIISSLHPAYQKRLIMTALGQVSGHTDWSRGDVIRVWELLQQPGSSTTIDLKQKLKARKVYNQLILASNFPLIAPYCYELPVPGVLTIPETGETYYTTVVHKNNLQPEKEETHIDYDHIQSPLWVRSRLPGDQYRPVGLQGTCKLKRLFIDLKIPQAKRNGIPVLVSNKEILAVIGYRVAESVAVTNSTKNILVIKKVSDV